jgi:hypothetical protein
VSLNAGGIENLSPQMLKISASRAFGRIELSNVIADQGRSAFPSTSTGERRENMSQVFFVKVVLIFSRMLALAAKDVLIERG